MFTLVIFTSTLYMHLMKFDDFLPPDNQDNLVVDTQLKQLTICSSSSEGFSLKIKWPVLRHRFSFMFTFCAHP